MLNHVIFLLTRNSRRDKICITNKRAIAQLGRAPRLHARQCFFKGVYHVIKRLIEKSVDVMSYSMIFREQENNSLTKERVRSNLSAFLGA